ncbi:DEAD/DEAH box helicase [Nannocystis sp. SCPEA4]|uniref:DEAD/DEAH box helicase n=1 Tax=Nannocystis sp. SCPEA4 TaxID=2996787 RepID=UPI002270388C|nr:DEAD/DEAH box helicase [Nannocystis sp. SCPEA4]MCY1059701.1 DEAD/DEAH box helicase [Nannocystis sp. SCPEA4]
MTAFDRLSATLQHQITHQLGFRELRPVQNLAIDAILDGHNCVVLAPTAGGKTEAAFFPTLSAMDSDDWRPVSLLYLSPIRALLNNQEARVQRYTGLLGRRAFVWHGDVGPGPRRRFLADPGDVLLTTPESIEAMLMSPRVSTGRLLSSLRCIIIDEVHAFADDDRGAHLSALLERLTRLASRDLQRIGLSATIGNPDELLVWLQGSSRRPGQVIRPPSAAGQPQLTLDHVGSLANAAHVIEQLHRGRKRLVFADSRRTVEELAQHLLQLCVTTHVAHGSLSGPARREAERAFESAQDCVIVATSALELGIDVGDLDHVLQIDSPARVASFLQRMGRTGRRAGTIANCTFLTTSEAATLQAAALLNLHARGCVEPVRPSRRAFHILAHQLLALALQLGGAPATDLLAFLGLAGDEPRRVPYAFADITPAEAAELVTTMLARGILADHGGRLWLGPRGEQLYGRRHFAELYAVFSAPRLINVHAHDRELGAVDAKFLEALGESDGPATFTLGGRAWQVTSTDWSRAICRVVPAERGGHTRWTGNPRPLSAAVCQSMRRILCDDSVPPIWSARARKILAEQRALHAFLRDDDAPLLRDGSELCWWNFAGGRTNLLLARLLEAELGGKVVARDVSLSFRQEAGASEVAVRELLARCTAQGRPTPADALRFAASATCGRLSKFEPCLPESHLASLQAEALLADIPSPAKKF